MVFNVLFEGEQNRQFKKVYIYFIFLFKKKKKKTQGVHSLSIVWGNIFSKFSLLFFTKLVLTRKLFDKKFLKISLPFKILLINER
jgi:hypothetical protein